MWAIVCSSPAILCHPRALIRINLVFCEHKGIPNSVLSPISSSNNIFSNCPSLNHPESRWPSLGLQHLPIHNSFQHTFQHVLPSHRTSPLFFREVILLLLQHRYVIRTPLCICRCMRISHRTDTSHCSGAQVSVYAVTRASKTWPGDEDGILETHIDLASWALSHTRAWEKFTCAYYEVRSSVYFCTYVLTLSVGYRWLHISFWRWWRQAVQGVRSCQGRLVPLPAFTTAALDVHAISLPSRSGCVQLLKTVLLPLRNAHVPKRCEATRPRGISFRAVRDSVHMENQWNNEWGSDATSWDQLSEAVRPVSPSWGRKQASSVFGGLSRLKF